MGFPQNLLSIFSNKTNNSVITARAPLVQKALINQYTGKNNPDVNLKNAELISVVYLCIKTLADNISRLPVSIWQQDATGKKTLYKNHEYYNSLRYNPKPYLSYQQWIVTTITHLFLRGNAYSFIRPDGTFEIVHPDYVVDASIVGDTLWYLLETPDPANPNNTIQQVVKYSDLLHFKLISKDGLFGLNPVDSLRLELNIDNSSQLTVKNFFANNATTTKVLNPLADFGKTDIKKIQELIDKFQNDVAGYNNAGQLYVPPFGYKLDEMQLNVESVQFLDASKLSRASVAALFGVPLYLLNLYEYTTKYEEQRLAFADSIAGIINILRAEMENKLLAPSEKANDVTIEFDTKKLVETNLTDKVNAYKTLYMMGAVSPNDIQKEFGLEQSDAPQMSLHYIQSQNIPLEYVTPELIASKSKQSPSNNTDNSDDQNENPKN